MRCASILRCLEGDHEVTVFAPTIPAEEQSYQNAHAWIPLPPASRDTLFKKLENIAYILLPRRKWAAALHQACRQYAPQVVWFSLGHWGQYARIPRQYGARTVMDTHNVQSDLTRQESRSKPWRLSRVAQFCHYLAERWHERHLFKRFDRVTSVCERDRRYHAGCVGDARSVLLPNFVDEQEYSLAEFVERDNFRVVITGSFSAFQNYHGARWFLERCWPTVQREVPRANLFIVGSQAKRLEPLVMAEVDPEKTVFFLEDVPQIAEYLGRAAVAVVPILHGSGTRFKVLEAMACRTPVVSTTLGMDGLNLVHGQHILLADTGEGFSKQVVALLRDRDLRDRLAEKAYAQMIGLYTVQVNRLRIQTLIQDLIRV